MAKMIRALYQNGVFKPLTKVRLKDRQQVELAVIEREARLKPPTRAPRRRPAGGKGLAARSAYRIVGLFKSGLHDLSKHHDKYLYP